MTTICAYVDPDSNDTWIGWDSRVTLADNFLVPAKYTKAQQLGSWWIGLSGNPAANTVIAAVKDRIEAAGTDVACVAHEIMTSFKEADFKSHDREDPGPRNYGQWIMLVRRGCIWSLSASGSPIKINDPFFAEGSGSQFALGAACAMLDSGYPSPKPYPDILIAVALRAASKYDLWTGGEFTVQEVVD